MTERGPCAVMATFSRGRIVAPVVDPLRTTETRTYAAKARFTAKARGTPPSRVAGRRCMLTTVTYVAKALFGRNYRLASGDAVAVVRTMRSLEFVARGRCIGDRPRRTNVAAACCTIATFRRASMEEFR